ncbi:MAG TPA: hypothetical protein VG106_10925, partial [Vicinamibacterales bacterium]|nr:hypothetical protein [Vicinamibacterales bacterium]
MTWRSLFLACLVATSAVAQDVYVPPVPIGIKGEEAKTRTPKRPIPFPAEDEPWIRVRSPHFDIISSASEAQTRTIADQLETLASALTRFEQNAAPATIFVFAKRRESQPYFDLLIGREKTTVTGMYVRHDGGGTMFVDAAQRRFERTALHELIHDLLRQSDIAPPLWLEEGLAEYFGNAELRRNGIVAGGSIPEHVALLGRIERMPLEQLFAVKAESETATLPMFYAQSWAAVDWLMHLDRTRIWPFLQDLERGVATADALRTHYGKSLDEMEKAIRGRR